MAAQAWPTLLLAQATGEGRFYGVNPCVRQYNVPPVFIQRIVNVPLEVSSQAIDTMLAMRVERSR